MPGGFEGSYCEGQLTLSMEISERDAPCQDKALLFDECQKKRLAYEEGLAKLRKTLAGTSSKAEYDNQSELLETLRLDARQAERRLQQHMEKHGC
jgi:hypothetical protein